MGPVCLITYPCCHCKDIVAQWSSADVHVATVLLAWVRFPACTFCYNDVFFGTRVRGDPRKEPWCSSVFI